MITDNMEKSSCIITLTLVVVLIVMTTATLCFVILKEFSHDKDYKHTENTCTVDTRETVSLEHK